MALALLAVGLGAAPVAGIRPPSTGLLIGILHGAILGWRPRWIRGLVILDLGLVGWHGAAHAPVFFDLHFDTWMHLALIRRVVDHGLFPPDPYYRGLAAAPLTSIVHYAYGAVV